MAVSLDKAPNTNADDRLAYVLRTSTTHHLRRLAGSRGMWVALSATAIAIDNEIEARENIPTLGHFYNAVRLFGQYRAPSCNTLI